MNEDGGAEVDIIMSLPRMSCVLKEAKNTQEINSGGSSNDTMASDFSTTQFHAIDDGGSVIRNSIIYGVLKSSPRVTLYYSLLCIRVCVFL